MENLRLRKIWSILIRKKECNGKGISQKRELALCLKVGCAIFGVISNATKMGATLLGCPSQSNKDNGLPWRHYSKQDFCTPIIALTFPRASIVQWSCVSWPWFIVFVGVTKFQYCIALLKITCQSSVSKILVLKYLNSSFGYLIVEKYF